MEQKAVHIEMRAGLKISIYQDEDYQGSPAEYGDDALFLVNYHRDFEVRRDGVITKAEIKAYYQHKAGQGCESCDNQSDDGPCDEWNKVHLLEKQYRFYPLTMLSHSGIWLQMDSSFSCDPGGWDTSHVGLILVSRKEWKTEKKAQEAAQSLIKEWNDNLSGNVYGYVVEDSEGFVVDSVWGFTGDYDKSGCLDQARDAAYAYAKRDKKFMVRLCLPFDYEVTAKTKEAAYLKARSIAKKEQVLSGFDITCLENKSAEEK